MVELAKKIYLNKISVIYIFCICLGIHYFLISEMDIATWLFSSKYIGLYMNLIYFLFIVKRVNLYNSIHYPMKLRMQDEKYTAFLIKSLLLNLFIYFILVYFPFLLCSMGDYNLTLLFIYFGVVIIAQFINECLILMIVYKHLSSYWLSGVLFINILLQFVIIQNII